MAILVTGSMAIDRIMVFPDRFKNHILPDKLHILSVSFHVESLDEFFGGCAGNIAYGLKLLGEDPLIVATVGRDFGSYAAWMDLHGIRRDGLVALHDCHTSQCFITTDLDDNQIVAFHPGAMERASEARLSAVKEPFEWALVGPSDLAAMRTHAAELKARRARTMIDPGQQLINFEPADLLELMDGAAVYIVNDYEWAVTQQRTGLGEDELAARAEVVVVTRGAEGSWIRRGGERLEIPAVKPAEVVDPTGCGDAYRSGLLFGLARGVSLEIAGRLGSLMGSLAVEQRGTQSVEISLEDFRTRFEREFGAAF